MPEIHRANQGRSEPYHFLPRNPAFVLSSDDQFNSPIDPGSFGSWSCRLLRADAVFCVSLAGRILLSLPLEHALRAVPVAPSPPSLPFAMMLRAQNPDGRASWPTGHDVSPLALEIQNRKPTPARSRLLQTATRERLRQTVCRLHGQAAPRLEEALVRGRNTPVRPGDTDLLEGGRRRRSPRQVPSRPSAFPGPGASTRGPDRSRQYLSEADVQLGEHPTPQLRPRPPNRHAGDDLSPE